MHVVMAVDVRRRLTKHINEAVELALQLAGNLFERQSTLLRPFPNPFTQLAVARQARHWRKRHPERQHKMHADAQLWHLAAQLRRVFNRLSVNQGRCRGHNPRRQASIMP
jgi:hypothetical protein